MDQLTPGFVLDFWIFWISSQKQLNWVDPRLDLDLLRSRISSWFHSRIGLHTTKFRQVLSHSEEIWRHQDSDANESYVVRSHNFVNPSSSLMLLHSIVRLAIITCTLTTILTCSTHIILSRSQTLLGRKSTNPTFKTLQTYVFSSLFWQSWSVSSVNS
jgi:hypothetical protein